MDVDKQHRVDPHQQQRDPAAEPVGHLEAVVLRGAQSRQRHDDHDGEDGDDSGGEHHVGVTDRADAGNRVVQE
ncbi:MAG TPA: hypothetical protein VI217_10955 [Mycobacterium sp.]